ncbi:PAS domain-containing sensor histidine kinase [Gymnodinialimonas hymeniacidonis]|uniref:PAS domain-containing sensor histidine kinase n=1 Tax=Gymnodinialimonas hymeniacidonis TaxID=3126508 RepID=UPI0034C5E348
MPPKDATPDEAALRRLVQWIDGVDLPMFILVEHDDARLEFVRANETLGRVAGVPSSIFAGRSAEEIFPARMAAQLTGNYRACLDGDKPVSYEECLMIEGRETWWQTTLSKPTGFGGRVVLGIAVPTTEAKEREFAAAEAVSEMAARFDELQLFSTMAAHDARSPLATVSSLVDLVLDGFDDMGDGKVELLHLISKTVDEALEQIGSTLARSREFSGDVSRPTEVELGRLANDIAAMVDPEMTLEIDVPDASIECDAVVVQMGLRNLMANAARFAGERICVRLSEDVVRGLLILEVADDGPGLPKGTQLRDLSAEGERRDGNHGFGLRSVYQLLKSRGGTLEVRPALEQEGLPGARFRMEVPGRVLSGNPQSPLGQDDAGIWAEAS